MNSIICIAGPTASGKTALAVELAKEYNGEVVSCDSMQVYKRMDIGTAKPTLEERQGILHHMIDVAEPEEDFSVSRYIRGNDFAPFPSTGVRERLEQETDVIGMEAMMERLRAIDPEAAARIHDRKRMVRALEVYYETGETITEHNKRTQSVPPRYTPLWLGLDFDARSELYRRIDLRVDIMLQQGLVEEIRSLLDSGIPSKCTAMQAIGYKEFVAALEGKVTIEEAAQEVKQSSRRYAKRQLTWFKRNKAMHWLVRKTGESGEEILENARRILRNFDN